MIIPPGFGHVVHQFGHINTNQDAAITYGVDVNATDFGQNLVAILHGIIETRIMPIVSSEWELEKTLLKYGPVESGPLFEFSETVAGTNSIPSAPPQIAYLVRKRTNLGGRKNRGRLFVPGVPEISVDGTGALASSARDDMDVRWAGVLSDLAAADLPMVILHSSSSDPTPVLTMDTDTLVGTQRRRLGR